MLDGIRRFVSRHMTPEPARAAGAQTHPQAQLAACALLLELAHADNEFSEPERVHIQKMVLAEVMWGVILADGTIAEHEAYLVRKLANLLNLEPGYLAQARRSAAEER